MEVIDRPEVVHGDSSSSSEDEQEEVTFAPQWSRKVRLSYTVVQLRELRTAPLSQRIPSLPAHLVRDLAKEERGLLPDDDLPSPTLRHAARKTTPNARPTAAAKAQPEDEDMERRFRERFGAFKSMFSEEEHETAAAPPAPVGGSRLLGLLHKQPEEAEVVPEEPEALPASVAALFASVSATPPPAAAAPAAELPASVAALFAMPAVSSPAGRPVSLTELFASAAPPQPVDGDLRRLFGSNFGGLMGTPAAAPTSNFMTLDDLEK
jgi:hypothetical protein